MPADKSAATPEVEPRDPVAHPKYPSRPATMKTPRATLVEDPEPADPDLHVEG